MAQPRPIERLITRLNEECGTDMPLNCELRRTYSGRHQRAAGAWSWWITPHAGRWKGHAVGGYASVTELLRAKGLTMGESSDWQRDWIVDPVLRDGPSVRLTEKDTKRLPLAEEA